MWSIGLLEGHLGGLAALQVRATAEAETDEQRKPMLERYEVVHVFPRSSEDRVMVVRCHKKDQKFVIKTIKNVQVLDGRLTPPNEAKLILDLPRIHPNVIRTFECQPRPETPEIVDIRVAFCEAGDIYHLITKLIRNKRTAPELLVFSVSSQLILALAYLHHGLYSDGMTTQEYETTPMIHGDIKPDNVFFSFTDSASCKRLGLPDVVLADFGHARPAYNPHSYSATPAYCPPERRPNLDPTEIYTSVTTKTDIWNLGALLHHLATLQPPRVFSTPTTPLPPHYMSKILHELIPGCLRDDPRDRASARQLLKHVPKLNQLIDIRLDWDRPFCLDLFELAK